MSLIIRLSFVASACLLLSSCQLINAALRLAPLALFLVDDGGKAGQMEARGKAVQSKGPRGLLPQDMPPQPAVALKR